MKSFMKYAFFSLGLIAGAAQAAEVNLRASQLRPFFIPSFTLTNAPAVSATGVELLGNAAPECANRNLNLYAELGNVAGSFDPTTGNQVGMTQLEMVYKTLLLAKETNRTVRINYGENSNGECIIEVVQLLN